MSGRDRIRARAKRDGISYAEALQRMAAEDKVRRDAALATHKPGATMDEYAPVPPPRAPKVHRRYASILTGAPAEDESMRSRPRCRPGFSGPIWTPDDPRLTDDPAAVTCGQCRRFDS